MLLSTELVKNATFLERMYHMDSLTSIFSGKTCEVWGLASKCFPSKFMPENADGYICFIGISPEKIRTSYGHVHFIEFGHEPISHNEYDDDMGILDHMCVIYSEYVSREEYDSDDNIVYLYPKKIKERDINYWLEIAEHNWGIKDRQGVIDYLERNELTEHVDWHVLYDNMPKIYYPSECVYSESDTESEEGEIKEYDHPPQKRRKLNISSDDET